MILRSRAIGTTHRFGRLSRFLLVGVSGLAVNQIALYAFTELAGFHYLVSAVVATQWSTAWNFALAEIWVFDADRAGRLRRFVSFAIMNNAWLVLRGPFLVLLTDVVGIDYLVSNLLALGSTTLVRFVISDGMIWRDSAVPAGTDERRVGPTHLYDIHGIVRISSHAILPELAYFRVTEIPGSADIEISVSPKSFGGLRAHTLTRVEDETVEYVEHLGRWGFAVRIEPGPPTEVHVSSLIARSPHVLYTNIVEPLLRWNLVRNGYALIHAACLEIDDAGTLITAQTDTGKTTTCLMSVRNHGTGFLSDDMVIVDESGTALAFPKPLTISAHTLRAARAAPLRAGRRFWLQIQGRVHSRGGRRTGLALARANLPICTLNAWLQRLVPPPKFHIAELVPDARIVRSVPITHMGVIERGATLVQPLLDLDGNIAILRANTEDAYGFPPYPLIADALANGDHEREEALRRRLLDGLPVTRIRTSDRHWYEQLHLVATEAPFASQLALHRPDHVPDGDRRPEAGLEPLGSATLAMQGGTS